MNLTYVRKYQRFLRKTQGIFYKNPLLSLGLALPLVVIPSYGLTGTTAISAVMLVCFIPTVLIASLLRKKVPQPWRAVLYPLISCLLLIPSRMMVKNVSPLIFDSLGVYFSLICVNSLLIYTVEKVQLQKPSQALGFALRQWLGATAALSASFLPPAAFGDSPFCKIRPASLLRRWPWEDFCSLAFLPPSAGWSTASSCILP